MSSWWSKLTRLHGDVISSAWVTIFHNTDLRRSYDHSYCVTWSWDRDMGQGPRESWRGEMGSEYDHILLYTCMKCSKSKTQLCITPLLCELTSLLIKCKHHCVSLQSITLIRNKNSGDKRTGNCPVPWILQSRNRENGLSSYQGLCDFLALWSITAVKFNYARMFA